MDDASSVRHTDTDSALEEVEEVEEEGELREEKWEEEWVADAGHADGASSDEEEGGDESTALSSEPARKVCVREAVMQWIVWNWGRLPFIRFTFHQLTTTTDSRVCRSTWGGSTGTFEGPNENDIWSTSIERSPRLTTDFTHEHTASPA